MAGRPLLIGVPLAAAASALTVFEPTTGLVLLAVPCAMLLWLSAQFRALYLIFGALLVLQGQSTTAKDAYLTGVLWALVAAARTQMMSKVDGSFFHRYLRIISIVVTAVLAVSLPVALQHAVSFPDWFSSAAAYMLFASVPVFVSDFVANLRPARQRLAGLLVGGGLLAALAFSIQWAQYRGLASLSVERFVWPSYFLAAAAICYCSARAFQFNRRSWAAWVLLTVLALTLMLVNGTRTSLLLFVPIMVLAWATPGTVLRRIARLASVPLLICAVVACVLVTASAAGISLSQLTDRFGSLVSSPQTDASLSSRTAQTQIALRLFETNYLAGVGPGYSYFVDNSLSLDYRYTLGLDSPAGVLSEFGILGIAMSLLAVGALAVLSRRLLIATERSPATLALVGYLSLGLVSLVSIGSPVDDKGFSLGLVLLLTLASFDVRGAGTRNYQEGKA